MALTLLAPAATVAQTTQTAAGANKFIASLVANKKVQPTLSFWRNPQGQVTGQNSWWSGAKLVSINPSLLLTGNADHCSMVIRSIERAAPNIADTSISYQVPIQIDWGSAALRRYDNGTGIDLQVPVAKYEKMLVRFEVSDPDLLDRLEYAMKFLQMSCDSTSSTGF